MVYSLVRRVIGINLKHYGVHQTILQHSVKGLFNVRPFAVSILSPSSVSFHDATMPTLRWRSNELTPTSSEGHLEEIEVPHTGFYGLFLGSENDRDKFEVLWSSSKTQRECFFEGRLSYSGESGDGQSNSFAFPLPFRSDPKQIFLSRDTNSTVLTSSRIGRIVWLKEKTKVSVKWKDDIHRKEILNDNGDLNWKWGLVFHMLADPDSILDENILQNFEKQDQESQQATEIFYSFQAHQIRNKPFICTECSRKFANPKAVHSHYLTAHASSQDSSSLIGPSVLRKPLQVAHEDDDLVIVVKPQKLAVQGERWTLSKSDLLLPFCAPRDR